MANRQDDYILMKQVISKLLDSQRLKVPPNSPVLQLLHPTIPRHYKDVNTTTKNAERIIPKMQRINIPTERETTKQTSGKVLVFIGWILLALNAVVFLGSLNYYTKFTPNLHTIENSNYFIFRMIMLALGAFILGWTTRLYLRKKSGETLTLPALIIIALGISLILMVQESDGNINIQGLGQNLLSSFSSTTTPANRLVTGILYSENKPSAIIGNRIVHEGDTLYGIKVIKIYEDKVEFEKNDKRWIQSVEKNTAAYSKIN